MDWGRIGTNCLTLLIMGFLGWVLYSKFVKDKPIDFSSMFAKFNLRGKR